MNKKHFKILFLLLVLILINPVAQTFSEERQSIEKKIENIEKLLNEMEKKQRAQDVINNLQQTEDEKKQKEEDILDAAGSDYIFAAPGIIKFSYNLTYTGDTYDQISQTTNNFGKTATRVRHVNTHNISNSISAKIPIVKNIAISASIPFKFKYTSSQEENKKGYGMGDPRFTIQYQPFKSGGKLPTTILNAGISMPLGSSPYEIDDKDKLATGNGYYSLSVGANLSKTIDPVIAYGGIYYNNNLDAKGFKYNLNKVEKDKGIYLYKVNPGSQISANIGMGYSLSYIVSVSTGLQYSYTLKSAYYWTGRGKSLSSSSYDASLLLGSSWKISHKRAINTSLSIGLFSNDPDISLSISIPFDIKF
ncbi:MAG: hypothetical protein CSA18_04335 [Deltaproteobacteria bacterium]|nr:MAG: hypothetical protein CSA18_04335 [Deltaproteobacteria bacterium]